MFVCPEKPYSRLKPYSMTVEVAAPNNKYLKPDSVDLSSRVMNPARIYIGMEVVSIAR